MALAVALAVLVLVVLTIRSCSSDGEPPEPVATPVLPAECTGDSRAALRRLLGRRIVVRMDGEATRSLLRQARAGEIGGVILFPPEDTDPRSLAREIDRLQEAGSEPLLVAIDQEGGEVKRLPELPPDLAPPELAGDPAVAEEQGLATGRALAELGINVDLAPVLDVPASPDSFLAPRAFGSRPSTVAETGGAFASGLARGGVAATGKHFPGLGEATANTDLAPAEVPGLAGLEPFREAIAAGLELVMLSNAVHTAVDARRPAFASPAAEELLRDRIGFTGVTITDDLGAGAVRARYDTEGAAIAAAGAGADLLLFALTSEPGVLDALVAAAERGRLDPAAMEASCARIAALREDLQI